MNNIAKKRRRYNTVTKKKKTVTICDVHIHITFNNIIVSVTNTFGDVIVWSSAGKMGFKGSRRATPFAAKLTIEDALKRSFDNYSTKAIETIIVKGICASREAAIREVIKISSFRNMPPIKSIKDITPIPHNGCKSPKKRRV